MGKLVRLILNPGGYQLLQTAFCSVGEQKHWAGKAKSKLVSWSQGSEFGTEQRMVKS
ncbi:MAG: hypothetical protein PHZ03_02510 [Syntrophomonas sp.]|nr:hypothetical protein [Syntrophomonas sp.]